MFFYSIFIFVVRENFLIEGLGNGIIGDFVVMNIICGCDYGLLGYIEFVKVCVGLYIGNFGIYVV